MEPVKQHIVPKVYLKNFSIAGKEGFVYALKIKSKYPKIKISEQNVASICYANDFYTIETKELLEKYSLVDRYTIEKRAFPYENNLKNLIEKIGKEKQLNSLEAQLLVKSILDIKKRNKAMADFYNNELDIRQRLEKYLLKARFELTFFKAELKKKGIDIDVALKNAESIAFNQFQKESYRLDLYREGFLEDRFSKGFEEKLSKLLLEKNFTFL